MKHLQIFNSKAEMNDYLNNTPLPSYPYVFYTREDRSVAYSGPEVNLPFYFESIEALQVTFSNSYEYSRDGLTWIAATKSTVVSYSTGERIYYRASGLTASSSSGIGKFAISSGTANIGGNLMSMLYGADYRAMNEIGQNYAFIEIFKGCKGIISAKYLALPATILTTNCYKYMFYDCTSLVNAPVLPATTAVQGCYAGMFRGCTSLVAAPALPATTLTGEVSSDPYYYYGCYAGMFYGCTSLVSAPALPATTLANFCYTGMFYGCTGLVDAPALPATTLAWGCYRSMFSGCTNLVNAPALPATTLAQKTGTISGSMEDTSCYSQMFSGCTSLVNAPALPATTLVTGGYYRMFADCTSLVNAPALPATTLSGYCYYSMFSGCTSLVNAPALPATTLKDSCYYSMFSGCTSLVAAPALPATTLKASCYYSMFSGCTSLVAAPALPATTLIRESYSGRYIGCYQDMFNGCASLQYIKALFLTTPSDDYTRDWVSGVAQGGTFVKNSAATWDVTGENGIPEGWTVETADE